MSWTMERVQPLVSIVIPAYNNAEYLAQAIESALGQSYGNIELIVSDHSSTDDTFAVMRGFERDERVTLLSTPSGGGALRNWNRVSEAARGKYIKLLCGDDLLYPNIVGEQASALESSPTASVAASSRDVVNSRGRVVVRNRGLKGLRGVVPGHEAIRRTVVAGTNLLGEPGSVMFVREHLARVGFWDARFPYLIDEATYVRVLMSGDLAAVPGPLAAFRLSETQWSARLIHEQAAQTVGFHDALHEKRPDIITSADLKRGNTRARRTARGRRLAYLYVGARTPRKERGTSNPSHRSKSAR